MPGPSATEEVLGSGFRSTTAMVTATLAEAITQVMRSRTTEVTAAVITVAAITAATQRTAVFRSIRHRSMVADTTTAVTMAAIVVDLAVMVDMVIIITITSSMANAVHARWISLAGQ